MSQTILPKVTDTQVQQKLKEVLALLDDALPRLNEHSQTSRKGSSGCQERIRYGNNLSPTTLLEQYEDENYPYTHHLTVNFTFFLHSDEVDEFGDGCCSDYMSIAKAEKTIVKVERHKNGTWSSVTETMIIGLNRKVGVGAWSNNALSGTRTCKTKSDTHTQYGISTVSKDPSSVKLLVSLEELDDILESFVALALADSSH